jgi:hypothetical protein
MLVTPNGFTGTAAIDSTTGVVTIGNAGPAGTYVFTGIASDACNSATQNFTLNVVVPPSFTSPNTEPGTVGTALNFTLAASGTAPITFVAPGLPGGLSLTGSLISGTPTTAGQTVVTVTASNGLSTQQTLTFTIGKGTAAVNLGSLTPTYDGTPKAATATTTPANLAVSFTYNGSSTAPATAGNYAVVATVNDANYQGTANGTLTIGKATPSILWSTPSDITYGTALSATQLNATANTLGTFTYTPASGTTMSTGSAQTLSVNFAPTDTTDYNNAGSSVSINVLKTGLTVTAYAGTKVYGTVNPAFTGTLSGAVSGDGITDSYSSTANTSTPVGT